VTQSKCGSDPQKAGESAGGLQNINRCLPGLEEILRILSEGGIPNWIGDLETLGTFRNRQSLEAEADRLRSGSITSPHGFASGSAATLQCCPAIVRSSRRITAEAAVAGGQWLRVVPAMVHPALHRSGWSYKRAGIHHHDRLKRSTPAKSNGRIGEIRPFHGCRFGIRIASGFPEEDHAVAKKVR
jgi:hypothetical protein